MPRRNRIDPWGDLHAVPQRGLFTGNRGCLLDERGDGPVRHHNGSLWIICQTSFRDWRHPLDAPRTWTPLFFLDDAVALAAGHRPCGLCRREDYLAYRHGVTTEVGADRPVLATELNRRLAAERLPRGRPRSRGRGRPGGDGQSRGSGWRLERAGDRRLWVTNLDGLPTGAVVLLPSADEVTPMLVVGGHLRPFGFDGWGPAQVRPAALSVRVLTPPTSVAALDNGFSPTLHPSAQA